MSLTSNGILVAGDVSAYFSYIFGKISLSAGCSVRLTWDPKSVTGTAKLVVLVASYESAKINKVEAWAGGSEAKLSSHSGKSWVGEVSLDAGKIEVVVEVAEASFSFSVMIEAENK